jgi:hypothetical protein
VSCYCVDHYYMAIGIQPTSYLIEV